MNRVLYKATFLILFLTGFAQAEPTGRVRGKVLDPSGKPISQVTIKIEYQGEMTQNYTATTNEKGEYIHIGIKPGKYRLTPSKEGYKPVEYAYYEVHISPSDRPVQVDMKMEVAQQATAQPDTQKASEAVAAAAQEEEGEKAVELLNQGKINEAVQGLEKVVEKDPTNANMQYNLGVAYERRDQYEKARQRYEEAIKIKPDFGDAFLAIGNSFIAQKKFGDAITPLAKAAELLPSSYEAAYNLGVSYHNTGNFAEAEAGFRKAIAMKPKEPFAHQLLGMALLGQSKNEEAKMELQKYLELNPNAADKADIVEILKSL